MPALIDDYSPAPINSKEGKSRCDRSSFPVDLRVIDTPVVWTRPTCGLLITSNEDESSEWTQISAVELVITHSFAVMNARELLEGVAILNSKKSLMRRNNTRLFELFVGEVRRVVKSSAINRRFIFSPNNSGSGRVAARNRQLAGELRGCRWVEKCSSVGYLILFGQEASGKAHRSSIFFDSLRFSIFWLRCYSWLSLQESRKGGNQRCNCSIIGLCPPRQKWNNKTTAREVQPATKCKAKQDNRSKKGGEERGRRFAVPPTTLQTRLMDGHYHHVMNRSIDRCDWDTSLKFI